jgi:ABC-type sugar transport system ATPase subunit
MIEAIGLSKFYRDFAAIRDVSFTVPQGQVAAFLGPNGAGKSTTMKILTGYLAPTAGSARVAGVDVVKDRIGAAERLGYLPENGPLYPEMTPLSLLRFFGRARGMDGARLRERIDEVIRRCALESVSIRTRFGNRGGPSANSRRTRRFCSRPTSCRKWRRWRTASFSSAAGGLFSTELRARCRASMRRSTTPSRR